MGVDDLDRRGAVRGVEDDRVPAGKTVAGRGAQRVQGLLGKGAHRWLVVDDQDGWWQHGLYIGGLSTRNHYPSAVGGESIRATGR